MNATTGNADEDFALLEKIAKGDRSALERLYLQYHKRVFHFIKRFERNEATAEDLTNDVFIEIWQSADRFQGRSKVTSWILGIARFKALSERRKWKNTVDPDEALGGLEDLSDTPEVTALKSDKANALKECIRRLSEDHRVIIDLVYYQESSIKEVSEILEIPENTVKTRMFHARKNLSAMMKQAGLDRGWP